MAHRTCLALTIAAGCAAGAAAQPCEPHWERGADVAPDAGIHALASINEGGSVALYAGGRFTTIGGVAAERVARFNGSSWSSLGSGIPGAFNSHGFNGCCANVHSIAQGVSGSSVIIAGNFVQAGGQIVESIADYASGTWQSLAGGIANVGCVDCAFVVYATARLGYQASGPIYAAGSFDIAGGVPAARVARWDGQAWTALGAGIGAASGDPFPAVVQALATYNGSLYAAGMFTRAGSVQTRCIARWTGSDWVDVGGGFEIPVSGRIPNVAAMAVFDNGFGPQLYVAGVFDLVGGVPARNIARWNGTSWSALGSGVGSGPNDRVLSLAVFDDGAVGPALYVGGEFSDRGANIARWSHTSIWGPVGDGVDGAVHAMAALDSSLYVGGWFSNAGSMNSPFLARWSGCLTCWPNCDMSTLAPILNVSDYTCFLGRFAARHPYANCDESTAIPTLNVADFICFMNRFAAGCE